MEVLGHFVLLILGASVLGSSPSQTKQYRTDYVYNQKTDSFYKLHTETKTGWDVIKVCEAEGATLMVPSAKRDIVQLHGMFKQFPDLGDLVWVGKDGQSHDSAEEQPIIEKPDDNESSLRLIQSTVQCIVVNRMGEIESCYCDRRLPFICKVEAKDAPYDNHCGVFAANYKYLSATGSCYKVPQIAYSWNEAYAECRSEGAHLLVLNSEAEMLAVKRMVQAEPLVPAAVNPHYLHIGFREVAGSKHPRVFKTIFNQTLEEAGYSGWALTEPNDKYGGEPCGSIFEVDGKLNDISCTDRYGFICEKEIVITDRPMMSS